MRGQLAFEAMSGLSDGLILEAAEALGFTNERAAVVEPPRKREPSALGRFFSTGWGVAILCAVVSLTVLSGIIWAGQQSPAGSPGGAETETADYAGDSQTDVKVRHGDTEIYPQRFFRWATDWTWSGYIAVDGEGFEGIAANDYGNQPSLPTLRYAKDGSISPCELTMAKGYSLDRIKVYGKDMTKIPTPVYDGEFSYESFLQALPVGQYYVALQIRHKKSGYDYAFALEVFDPQEDTATEDTAEPLISMERAKEIASDYWGIKTGDVSITHGFEYRIDCRQTVVTSRGEEVYLVRLQWHVMPLGHWSTVATVWVEITTGEVIIPYEDLTDETEPDTEVETTAPDREDSTQKEPDTEPPASEDTTTTTDEPRRLQFPLTGTDDTDSYLLLPDLNAPEGDLLEFCVYPTDTDSTDPVAAFRLLLRTDGETNVQVIHYRNEDTYGFFYMHESSYVTDLDGIETRYVEMQASTLTFVTDRSYLNSTVYYYHADGGDSVRFGYSDAQRQSILARYKNTNQVALGRVEDMLYKISKRGDFEFTVVYSYIDGVETVNTPIEEMPTFDFPVFNEYGFYHD